MERVDDYNETLLDQQAGVKRKAYRSPQLIIFGSIEDLTQGSFGLEQDAPGTTPYAPGR